jgi:glycosyltransferase involved in cell wall biosynthesis
MAAPLRILHVCPRPNFSGLESYALQMAVAQSSLGHSVSIVVLAGSPLEQRAREAQLTVVTVGKTSPLSATSTSTATSNAPSHAPLADGLRVVFPLLGDVDIVHIHSTQDLDFMMLPLALAQVRAKRPRVILQTHIWISHSKKDPLHWVLYKLVDEIWCSSEPARATLEKFIPIAREKIRVIRYGRDIAALEKGFLSRSEARLALGLPQDATVVGTVARIDAGKGIRELYDACEKLMATEPQLHLMWIGPPTSDDPKAVTLAQEIFARALPHARMHFPGAVADSYKYLRAFDLFALPTYAECFSLALLEAQLASLPCLASASGGSPQIVRENETGWLFEPRSTDACLAALKRALGDRAKWPEYGARARAQVVDLYDSSKILPTTIDMYREVLARG